ncbi:MAG: hypothetical protein QOG34_1731 [Frankiaceae bacterium]|nr:hypothetical protein [Frankiaceae bacterium]
MPPQYLLHIGQQKSGTTYLQTVLHACEPARLESLGLCYPLAPLEGAPENNQQYAMFGLLGTEFDWVTPELRDVQRPAWDTIAAQAQAWDGPVLLSAEALSVIRTEAIHTLHEALGRPDDVTVVITTRDLGATIASSWQQHVRNGRGSNFDYYLETLENDRKRFDVDLETAPELGFWRAYSIGRLARRWADVFGAGNVRVVTSPGKPIDLLWERFCTALGMPQLLDLPERETVGEAVHTSLTASEAMVMREINSYLVSSPLKESARGQLRTFLLNNMRERPDRGPRIAVPERYRETVAAWSNDDLVELEKTGVTICGSLDDIRYEPRATPDVTIDEVAAAAGAMFAAMMRRTPQPRPAPPPVVRPFPVVLRGYMAKWKLDFKRWLLAKWRSLTMVIALLAVVRVPARGPSGDGGAQLSMVDSVFGSLHDSVQFALSAGYG